MQGACLRSYKSQRLFKERDSCAVKWARIAARLGMHFSTFDPLPLLYVVCTQVMNRAARVAARCEPGQVLATLQAWQAAETCEGEWVRMSDQKWLWPFSLFVSQ